MPHKILHPHLSLIISLVLPLTIQSQPVHRNFAAAETNVIYQEMHVEIDPAINRVDGIITYIFSSEVDQLNRFVVDYADDLPIHFIRRGNTDLAYAHADNLINIDLGKNLLQGEQDTIVISFSSDNTLKKATHAGIPVISTDLDLATLWYPGKRDLVDKIDSVDIYVTTPPDQLVASNGILVSITKASDRWIHHWQHRYPLATTYLLNLAITNYTVVKDSVQLQDGSMLPLLHYLYPESLSTIVPEVKVTPDVMQLFESHFGPYPFSKEKYGHAQYTFGGALEVQTMPFMGFFNLSVIAHEMAHQWFGDMVTFGSWSDVWLSEGMAEYLSGLAIEALAPTQWNGLKNTKINSITSLPDGSVFVHDTNDLDVIFDGRLTYNKGFYLAHMLRWIVGDSLFFEGCRNYLNDPQHHHGFARTIDLQNHMEAVSNIDLDEFFADWFYGEGFPSYTLTWNQVQDSVIILVDQIQSDPSVSFFEMPITVAAYRFGIVADTVFHNTYNHQRFSMNVGNNTITQLILDQQRWILSNFNHIIKGTTAISDVSNVSPIRIYPNPASAFIDISNTPSIDEVELVGTSGIFLLQVIENGRVDISELPTGYYVLRLRDRDKDMVYTRSLVIQR
ncbi:MAG TPA: M1 family aminopeptidase [Saprospiraceae bacterium]|nr:M1 family aminopeptidase [Saprospiraceae bacterium]